MGNLTSGELAIIIIQGVQVLLQFWMHYDFKLKSSCCQGWCTLEESMVASGAPPTELIPNAEVVNMNSSANLLKTSPRQAASPRRVGSPRPPSILVTKS